MRISIYFTLKELAISLSFSSSPFHLLSTVTDTNPRYNGIAGMLSKDSRAGSMINSLDNQSG